MKNTSSHYCLKCRYPLQGLSETGCPECGRYFKLDDPATYARSPHTWRQIMRRWLGRSAWVAAAIALYIGAYYALVETYEAPRFSLRLFALQNGVNNFAIAQPGAKPGQLVWNFSMAQPAPEPVKSIWAGKYLVVPNYKTGGRVADILLAPAHWIDRHWMRQQYWAPRNLGMAC